MDDRILAVWRLLWPEIIPVRDYQPALEMARLVKSLARPPEVAPVAAPKLLSPVRRLKRKPRTPRRPTDLIGVAAACELTGMKNPALYERVRKGVFVAYGKAPMKFSRAQLVRAMKESPRRAWVRKPEPRKKGPPSDLITFLQALQLTGWAKTNLQNRISSGQLTAYGANPMRVSRSAVRALLPAPALVREAESVISAGGAQ